jgi:tetratricopeptide (TPR) repeat protein
VKVLLPWLLVAVAALPASAATPADVRECLAANDVPCAEAAVDALGGGSSSDPEVLSLAAETRFYAGDYDTAYEIVQRATGAGWADKYDDLGLYQRTADVMKDWGEVRRGNHVVRYRPGVDAVLVDDAFTVLDDVERNVAPLIGSTPPGPTIIEIYPDGRSFVACSSLTEDDVRTTGVVALSKWSRLLVTSPRALGRGYEWQDTTAHEFIHLIVAHATNDQTPVWMQEAIARYLDNRWRDGQDHFRLSPRDQGLLADALAEIDGHVPPAKQKAIDRAKAWNAFHPDEQKSLPHTGLVDFNAMHPSFAKLPSADMAALAYAQVSSLMSYCFAVGGEDVLLRALPRVRDGADPRVALAEAAGAKSFDQLQADWLVWLRAQNLSGRTVAELPTALDGADESKSDPVLADRQDLYRWLRLGDLLREDGHPKAALVEYAKAVDPEEPASPLVANRVAQAKLDLGDIAGARGALEESLESWPEFALSHKTLGAILSKDGQARPALAEYMRAAELNPFDPEVQQAIASLAKTAGNGAAATKAEAALKILRRGGPEPGELTPLHAEAK